MKLLLQSAVSALTLVMGLSTLDVQASSSEEDSLKGRYSVGKEDEWDNQSVASRAFSDRKGPAASKKQPSKDEELSYGPEDEWERETVRSGRDDVESNIQKLTDIPTLKRHFFKGNLDITPQNYKTLLEMSNALYGSSFENHDKGIVIKGWKASSGFDDLLEVLLKFKALKSMKVSVTWDAEADASETLARAIQYYGDLAELDIANCRLTETGLNDILDSIVSPQQLRVLDITGNKASASISQRLKEQFPNLVSLKSDISVGKDSNVDKLPLSSLAISSQKDKEAREKAKKESEERVKREAEEERKRQKKAQEEEIKRIAEESKRKKEEERLKKEAEKKAKKELEERVKREAEEERKRQKIAQKEEKKRLEEEGLRKKEEERLKKEAEKRAKKEPEERAKREAEEKTRKEFEEHTRREAEQRAKQELEARTRREAEEKARKENEERIKREAEERAKKEDEDRIRKEAEEKARKEYEERIRRETQERAQREYEERVRREAEMKVIPLIARGYEEIYKRFLKGAVIYRPNEGSEVGMITLPIAALANPLEGTFDLSQCGDAGKYLTVATGYRKGKIAQNADKLEIWLAPRFLIEKELKTTASHFQGIMSNWSEKAPVGIFWTWGNWDNLSWYDYLTTQNMDELSNNNLYEKWSAPHAISLFLMSMKSPAKISCSFCELK